MVLAEAEIARAKQQEDYLNKKVYITSDPKNSLQANASAMGLPDIDFKHNDEAAALMKQGTVAPNLGRTSPYENVKKNEKERHILGT